MMPCCPLPGPGLYGLVSGGLVGLMVMVSSNIGNDENQQREDAQWKRSEGRPIQD